MGDRFEIDYQTLLNLAETIDPVLLNLVVNSVLTINSNLINTNLNNTNTDLVANIQPTATASPILRQKKALPLGKFKIQTIKPNEASKVDSRVIGLISEFNEVVTEVIDNQYIKLKQVENLKRIKKHAKSELDNATISNETREALEKIVNQYDQLVESIQVLNNLRDMSRAFRNKPQTDRTYQAVNPNDFEEILAAPILNQYEPDEDMHVVEQIDSLIATKRENINEIATERSEDKEAWKENWTKTRRRLWNAAVESDEFLKQKKEITFTTGAKSSMLPQATKLPELAPDLSDKPALVPSGLLFEHNVPPLAGELSDGFLNRRGVNRTALSGTSLSGIVACLVYATQTSFEFNRKNIINNILSFDKIYSEVHLCQIRLQLQQILLTSNADEDLRTLKKHIKKLEKTIDFDELELKQNWEINSKLVGQVINRQVGEPLEADTQLKRGQIVSVADAQGNHTLMMVSDLADDEKSYICIMQQHPNIKLGKYKPNRINVVSANERKELRDSINDNQTPSQRLPLFINRENDKTPLSDLFDEIEPIKFKKQEKRLIKEAYPIIWASCNQHNIVASTTAEINSEIHYNGIAQFGTDIPVAFTDKEHVEELQELLESHGVQVMSFGAAYYICGLQKAAQRQSSEQVHTKTEVDKDILQHIQNLMNYNNQDDNEDFSKTLFNTKTNDDIFRTKSFDGDIPPANSPKKN